MSKDDFINEEVIDSVINFIINNKVYIIIFAILAAIIIISIKLFLYLGDKQVKEFLLTHPEFPTIQHWIDKEIECTGIDPRRTTFVRWIYFCVFRGR